MKSLRPWLANLALIVASLLVSLILIEVVLRVVGWSYPVFSRPDSEFGWSFRPNTKGWSVHEDTAYVRINRFGFRGGDVPEQPPADTLRIAVLGDSFVDSGNLSEKQSFTGQIESHLAACPAFKGRRVEVLNFGVSGYGATQELLRLQELVARFHPRMVLLGFYIGNDVPDNSRPLSVWKDKPYFIELPSGELRFDTSFRESEAFRHKVATDWRLRLINWSYLLQALKEVYLQRPIVPFPLKSQVFKATDTDPIPGPQYAGLFAPPGDNNWRSAWAVTEKLLLRIRDWSQSHKIDFRLAIIPDPTEGLPGEARRQAAVQKFDLTDLDYPIARIARFAASNGIPYVSLLEPLRMFADDNRQYTYGFNKSEPGDGHLNAFGNEISGRTIAAWLCPAGANRN
jgi:hypothetical protein